MKTLRIFAFSILVPPIAAAAEFQWRVGLQPQPLTESGVTSLSIRNNGTVAIDESSGYGDLRTFWNGDTGERIAGEHYDPRAPMLLDLASDGQRALSTARDGQLYIGSAKLGGRREAVKGVERVQQARFLPGDDMAVAIGGSQGSDKLYGISTTAGSVTWVMQIDDPSYAQIVPEWRLVVVLAASNEFDPGNRDRIRFIDARYGTVAAEQEASISHFSSVLQGQTSTRYRSAQGGSTSGAAIIDVLAREAWSLPGNAYIFSETRFYGDAPAFLVISTSDYVGGLYRVGDPTPIVTLPELGYPAPNWREVYLFWTAVNEDASVLYLARDKTVERWALGTSATKTATYAVGEEDVTAVALSPDGATLAVGDASGSAHFLSAMDGELLWSAEPLGISINEFAFSPDGGRVVMRTSRYEVATLRTSEGSEPVRLFEYNTENVAYASQLDRFISSAMNGFIEARDPGTLERLVSRQEDDPTSGVAIAHRSGRYVARLQNEASHIHGYSVREAATGDVVWEVETTNPRTAWISPSGERIAVSPSSTGSWRIFAQGNAEPVFTSDSGTDVWPAAVFSPDDRYFARFEISVAGFPRVIRVANLEGEPIVENALTAHTLTFSALFSPDSEELFVLGDRLGTRVVQVYSLPNLEPSRHYALPSLRKPTSIVPSDLADRLLLATSDGFLSFLYLDTGEVAELGAVDWAFSHSNSIYSPPTVAYDPNSGRILARSRSGRLTAFQLEQARPVAAELLRDGDGLWISFQGEQESSYQLETSGDLSAWTPRDAVAGDDSDEIQLPFPWPNPGESIFGRIMEVGE